MFAVPRPYTLLAPLARLAPLVLVLVFAMASTASADLIGNEPIATVAGTGTAGDVDDDPINPTALGSQIVRAFGVAVDEDGNLYIADAYGDRVRRVVLVTGIITTVAGTGSPGDVDDDPINPTAAGSQLSFPHDVALDHDGNLYIADRGNARVRKVDLATGHISTVLAAGPDLGDPYVIDIDDDGNLYIADIADRRVRRVDVGTGLVTTVAGNGAGGISVDDPANPTATGSAVSPYSIAVDGNDNLYIAEAYNQRVRRVDLSTGLITTVAGTGTQGNVDDDPTNPTAAGSQVNTPVDVVVDSDGDLYISELGNFRVRRVDVGTGQITTVAGNGTRGSTDDDPINPSATGSQLEGPYGIAVDINGSLYISETDNYRVRVVTADSTPPSITALDQPVDPVTNGTILEAEFACTDSGSSGLATCTATLDGAAIGHGDLIDTTTPGDRNLVVTAADNAGNTTVTTVAFRVARAIGPRELTGDYAATSGVDGFVARFYMAVFNRQPDGLGYDYWVRRYSASEVSSRYMAAHFITSEEFTATYGNLTDAQFVDRLYLNVVNRPGDARGVTFWNNQLANGMSRSEVVLHFSESPEFKTLTGTS